MLMKTAYVHQNSYMQWQHRKKSDEFSLTLEYQNDSCGIGLSVGVL